MQVPIRSRRAASCCGALFATLLLAFPALADAGHKSFRTGLSAIEGPNQPALLGEAKQAKADIIRVSVTWAAIAQGKPTNASDPGDPAYRFAALDSTVRAVKARGFTPLLTVTAAPRWAEGAHRPRSATPGAWKPQSKAFGKFARALARRYSGTYHGLPRVRFYEAWNEPNLSGYLAPQYVRKRQVSAARYRKLLNAFYRGAKGVHRGNVIVTGGTAPYGDRRGGRRTRPLTFLRKLLCLNGGRHRHRCHKAKFDVLAHHPINATSAPTRPAASPRDAVVADFHQVRALLRRAERRHTIATRGRHPLWATEIWWESDPPDSRRGVPLRTQARYIEQALYLLWKQGATVVINLQVRDPVSAKPRQSFDAGIFFVDGRKKPAFKAFRFPFVTDRSGRHGSRAWGRSPSSGRLAIQVKRRKHWRTVRRLHVRAGRIFTTRLKARRGTRIRAQVAGERSLVWSQK